jgi:hypothetical protein
MTLSSYTIESQREREEDPRLVPHVRSLNSRNPDLKLSFIPAEFVKTTARALFILLSLSEVHTKFFRDQVSKQYIYADAKHLSLQRSFLK